MPFSSLKFRYPWRPYQTRVLDAIDAHLSDQRLHIVAAPGAGKTILGLEVFRRLKKRTLILSPTRTIRDQWIQRLEDFLDGADPTNLDWISQRLDAPKLLTSVTYQALHYRLAGELNVENEIDLLDETVTDSELDRLVATLRTNQIDMIIMDEAHHLRAEWWRALNKLLIALPHLTLVSLTATPPYDGLGHEWRKYEQLCGTIDEEISIPELVKGGTLCPHQDFVWAVNATESEQAQIEAYDKQVSILCNSLFDDEVFNDIVISHPWVIDSAESTNILKDPKIAVAILSFMKAREYVLLPSLFEVLDLTEADVPEFGRKWWQVLIHAVLFSPTFEKDEAETAYVEQLKKQLRAVGLLQKRELSIEHSRRLARSLSLSPAKIQACADIHLLESAERGAALRQVILTDYIRDEALNSTVQAGDLTLGALPIFQALIAASPIPQHVALLTGRLSLIHNDLVKKLQQSTTIQLTAQPFNPLPNYQRITSPISQLVGSMTNLLMHGDIKTLVGTRALLGEGWDAPAVNSLILATSAGSFMVVNQMRGRAIRIDKRSPEKVSSIWHLVALNTQSQSGLSDYQNLQRRFETFVGLSEKSPTIESGFQRLNTHFLTLSTLLKNGTEAATLHNHSMGKRLSKLTEVSERWHTALTIGDHARTIPSVRTASSPVRGVRKYYLQSTFGHLLFQLATATVAAIAYSAYEGFVELGNIRLVFMFVILMALAELAFYARKTAAAVKILAWHLPVDGALKQIGLALSHALCDTGLIDTPIEQLEVNSTRSKNGAYHLSLTGGTFYESSLFADCLAEVLSPIDNPRYLVVRKGKFLKLSRQDYHAVPIRLGVKKELAQAFHKAWSQYVGPCELIYTRGTEGRATLLKARMRAFSSAFTHDAARQDRWQ